MVPKQVHKGQLNNKDILEDFNNHSVNICRIIEQKSIIKKCRANVINMLTGQVFKLVDENNKTIEQQNNIASPDNKLNVDSDSSDDE